jgi:hypothetical protein
MIDFIAAFDEYCCIFDEICNVIMETFHLNNLLNEYDMVYYDPSYNLWIGFNIHVTKRITEVIRHSTSKTLKIRIERCRRPIPSLYLKRKTIADIDCKTREDCSKLLVFLRYGYYRTKHFICLEWAHLIIWLDEHIGNPACHKQLKRDCRAMINTNTSFIMDDTIDTSIQYNNFKSNADLTYIANSKYFIETTRNYSRPFQCTLFTVDNTDLFFEYVNMTLYLTQSLSIIISEHFAKEILPSILSRKQKQLLPDVLFLYVLCSDICNNYDWALGYVFNDKMVVPKHLQFFDDEKALFVRLLNDVRRHLTLEADRRRGRNENWHALQYYSASRQLFLNSLSWDPCYTLRELDHLDQLIKESELKTNESYLKEFHSYTEDMFNKSDERLSQECAEIVE